MKNWLWHRLVQGVCAIGVVYIALIGIFAIEELQRREKTQDLLAAREAEISASLEGLAQGDSAQRVALETERAKVRGLRARLSVLMIGDAIQPKVGTAGTLKEILCEWEALRNADLQCPVAKPESELRELGANVVLKRTCEQRASGDIFAVLVIVAAVGGALIRLYLPNQDNALTLRPVLQAIGGGIVCYLVIVGGVSVSGASAPAHTSPAAGALFGLLAGMFSTKLFEVVTTLVNSWADRLLVKPKPDAPESNG